MSRARFKVHGIHLAVRLVPDESVDIHVVCPRGGLIRYGRVVARGDGADPRAEGARVLPPRGTIIVFEDNPEDTRGHEITIGDVAYRIITVDEVLLAIIPSTRQS